MIDWRLVFFGALWILGLSACLAAVSFAYTQSAAQNQSLRMVLHEARYRFILNLGLTLFCVGWLGNVEVWWERAWWGALALSFAWSLWQAWRWRT
jgi:hypothetical protein